MKRKCFNKKTILSMLLALLMLTTCSVNAIAAAADPPTVSPQWDNISTINLGMAFDGNEAVASASVSKSSNATFVEATMYLYKWENNDWVYMDEAYRSKSIGTLVVSIDFTCEVGVEYRAVLEVTAYEGINLERETVEYREVCSN